MIYPVLVGLIAAVVVVIPLWMQRWAAIPEAVWFAPVALLFIAALTMGFERLSIFKFARGSRMGRRFQWKANDGLADLFVHIHTPSSPDSAGRWFLRGVISLLLAVFGGVAGLEGAAVEFSHAFLTRVSARSSRWFEQRRRTDVAISLSAGVAAAFGAPFAGMLLPIELGIGGSNISSFVGAMSAFLAVRYLGTVYNLEIFDVGGALYGFKFVGWKHPLGTIAVAIGSGIAGAGVIAFVRYCQKSLFDLFRGRSYLRTLTAGILLFLVAAIYHAGHQHAWHLLEQVLWGRKSPQEVTLLMLSTLLSLALVLSGFGTIGFFWPLFALGGFFGTAFNHWILNDLPGFAAVAGLVGGASFWGAVLGTPFAGAILAYELTQNQQVLLPCLIAALLAQRVRKLIKKEALIQKDLEDRGLSLTAGRSASILGAVLVKDAMVTDHEIVAETESVSDLRGRLEKARYPFLPVVNAQGIFVGFLTADMVYDAWKTQESSLSNSPLSKLLEAKDLLYRSAYKSPTLKTSDTLASSSGIFGEIPCVPVLTSDSRVAGLLFVYNVRLAYDREVTHRSFAQDPL